jgi:hypothetical protein
MRPACATWAADLSRDTQLGAGSGTGKSGPILAVACPFEKLCTRPTDQAFLRGRKQIATAASKALNDFWSDVPVCQERKI